MYSIEKDINIKSKFGKYIYKETIYILIASLVIFQITKKLFINELVGEIYAWLGFIITFILTLPSKANPQKNIFNSLNLFLKKNNKTVKSFDKIFMLKKKNKNNTVKNSTLNYIDFLKFTDDGYIFSKSKSFIEILEIEGANLNNLTKTSAQNLIKKNQEFYVSYTEDIKLIYLKYYSNFNDEKQNLIEKIENEKDNYKKEILISKLKEFELTEKRKKNVYYICIFAKDREELEENINQLQFSFPLKLKNISQKNKEDIYFKLNNMNSEF